MPSPNAFRDSYSEFCGGSFAPPIDPSDIKHSNPQKWNKDWEDCLETTFYSGHCSVGAPDFSDVGVAATFLTQSSLSGVSALRKELCVLQFDLTELIIEIRSKVAFDATWLGISPQTREEALLRGLVDSCGGHPALEKRREHCLETMLRNLQAGGGRGFLDLLNAICPTEATQAEMRQEPIYISHPVWDRMFHVGEPSPKTTEGMAASIYQRLAATLRNQYLTSFLWHTMLRIFGRKEQVIAGKIGSRKERADMALPFNPSKKVQEWKKTVVADIEAGDRGCANCAQAERHLIAEGRKFLVCSRCKEIGRRVNYCDRRCQLNDWKSGNPAHRTICGKMLGVPDPIKIVPARDAQAPSRSLPKSLTDQPVPTSNPSFTPSAALLHQISLLQDLPTFAYHYILYDAKGFPSSSIGILLPAKVLGPLVKMFKKKRDDALRTGNPQSVAMMSFLLDRSGALQPIGASSQDMLKQLSKEYGIGFDTLTKLRRQESKLHSEMKDVALSVMEDDLSNLFL